MTSGTSGANKPVGANKPGAKASDQARQIASQVSGQVPNQAAGPASSQASAPVAGPVVEPVAGQAPARTPVRSDPRVLGFSAHAALAFMAMGAIVMVAAGYVYWIFEMDGAATGYSGSAILYRLILIVILMLFIPFTAMSFYFIRRDVRRRELRENCRALGLDYEHYYQIYKRETREAHFLYAVCFTSVITMLGLTAIFLGKELRLDEGANLLLMGVFTGEDPSRIEAAQTGPLLFFGMAFLGAYLWGLQNILHRYFTNDLVPGVYYGLGTRMIFSAIIALIIYHLLPDAGSGEEELGSGLLPALAFLIGMFPQRALQYMTEKVNVLSRPTDIRNRELPLELIQGISVSDKLRLKEEGLESCYDLANSDFIQLLFTTPFQPLELVDWQLQARLVLFFGDSVDELRVHGVRTISELKLIDDATAQELAEKTHATKTAIDIARRRAKADQAVEFLESLREPLVTGGCIKKGTLADQEGPKRKPAAKQAGDGERQAAE